MKDDSTFENIYKMPYSDLLKKDELIKKKIKKINIDFKYQKDLINKILKVAKITNNPKTRESYINSYIRTANNCIFKDGRDSSITIEITKKCNQNCNHCYSNLYNNSKEMDNKILNQIIEFSKKEYKHIFLTGGEPTLDERIFSIAKKNPNIMFFIFTNGSLITKDYAKKLSLYGNLVPILSIDGSNEQMHDFFKGEESYKKINIAIENLNDNHISWGYLSMVSEINASDVLCKEFVKKMNNKGAFIARYLEYFPVGKKAYKELILTGETYLLLENRKKEILEKSEIYIQETTQKKCTGLISFDVDGNIKNCPFFHYSKYNINDDEISKSIKKSIKEWMSYNYKGECPLYSDPIGFKKHLEKLGWKHTVNFDEEYLNNPEIYNLMIKNYQDFLDLKGL